MFEYSDSCGISILGGYMFNIDEIKFLCSLNKGPFYLSPKSSYEFLIYGDIDHFEILVDCTLEDWISGQRLMEYKHEDDHLSVIYFDEYFQVDVYSLEGKTIESYLNMFDFNFNAISIKISKEVERNAFACYKEACFASWIDPFQVKESIKEGFIRPMHYDELEKNGINVFRMVHYMMTHHLDIEENVFSNLKALTFEVSTSASDYFFDFLSHSKSYEYIKLLDDFGLIEATFPIVSSMRKVGSWEKGLEDLKKFETIMSKDDYFTDGVYRDIIRALDYCFPCKLTKYQLLKFSLLFKEAYRVMELKVNAPERYETSFTSFCDYFGFQEDTCEYYSQIIKSRNDVVIDMKNENISLEEQYEFYDEYQSQTIEVLLIYYIQQLDQRELDITKRFVEYLIRGYVNKYSELQSINNVITTMDIERHELSDVSLTLMIEDVKKRIFYGNLRYDRQNIISHLQRLIDEGDQ